MWYRLFGTPDPTHNLPLWALRYLITKNGPPLAHTKTLKEMGPILTSHAEFGYNLRAYNFSLSLDEMICYHIPLGVLALEI